MKRKPPLKRHARHVTCTCGTKDIPLVRDMTTDPRIFMHFEATCPACKTVVMLSFSPPLPKPKPPRRRPVGRSLKIKPVPVLIRRRPK